MVTLRKNEIWSEIIDTLRDTGLHFCESCVMIIMQHSKQNKLHVYVGVRYTGKSVHFGLSYLRICVVLCLVLSVAT